MAILWAFVFEKAPKYSTRTDTIVVLKLVFEENDGNFRSLEPTQSLY